MKFQKKALFLTLIIAFFCMFCMPVYAVVVATMGNPNSTGAYDLSMDSDRMLTANGGLYAKYEIITTNDTLTLIDSGGTSIIEGVGTTSFATYITLPDADVGLEYNFIVGGGMTPMTGGSDVPHVIINPQDTDTIYFVNSSAANTFEAGDSILSLGATGDSIRFTCGKDLFWYADNVRGTWTDND